MTRNKKPGSERPVKIGGAARDIIEKLKKNGGWGKYDQQAGFKGGKVILPGIQLSIRLQDLKELTLPDNPTPYMVEFVHIGRSSYLHLVKKPPLEILEAMSATPYSASNDIGVVMEALSKTLPSKPVAKTPPARKARKARPKPPARKPEPAIEETPEQKQKAYIKNLSAEFLRRIRGGR